MNKVLKAELLKERKNKSLYWLNGITLALILLIFLWQAYLSSSNIRQGELQIPYKAGAYSVMTFTTLFRKIWGILYGFIIINLECVENRKDFFVFNTGKIKLFVSKLIASGMVAFLIIFFLYSGSYVISAIVSRNFQNECNVFVVIVRLFLIWFMTIGNVLLGMLISLALREVVLVTSIVFTLEFFSSLYPQIIIDIWNRIDGYWYFSNLLKPIKEQLSGVNNYNITLSDNFSGIMGLVVWVIIYLFMVFAGLYSVNRKEF